MSKKVIIPIGICMLCIIVSVIVAMDVNAPEKFEYVYMLPLSFAVFSLLFYNLFANAYRNIIVAIILAGYFVKNVIAILVLSMGQYASIINVNNRQNIDNAILLMILETFVVFFVLNMNYKKMIIKDKALQPRFVEKLTATSKLLVFFAIIVLIIMWQYTPTIADNYVSIFEENVAVLSTRIMNESVERGTFERIVLQLFLFAFEIVRVVFSVIALGWIKKKIKNKNAAIILSLIFISVQFLFITSELLRTVLISFMLLWVMTILYTDRKKFILGIIFAVIGVGCCILAVGKMTDMASKTNVGESVTNELSALLQAYFPGVTNLAGVFSMGNYDKTEAIISDFYTMIPFRNTLFAYDAGLSTDKVYIQCNNAGGQIIPFVGEMYQYVGWLAPIVMGGFTYLALWFYKKYQQSKELLEKGIYMYIAFFCAISLFMYQITILGSFIVGTGIPMILVCKLLGRRKCNENNLYR